MLCMSLSKLGIIKYVNICNQLCSIQGATPKCEDFEQYILLSQSFVNNDLYFVKLV